MDERRSKREVTAVSITTDLILRLSQQTKLSKVTELAVRLQSEKVRVRSRQRIEGLGECANLRVLDLSYNFVAKIENLETLIQLRDLNLSENNIRKIEGLRTLKSLESLNLSGNQIRQLPRNELDPLSALKALKVMRNRIESHEELKNLASLQSLVSLAVEGNPVCDLADLDLFVVFHLPGLQQYEGTAISTGTRQKAMRKFEKAKADVYVVRENLVNYRKQLSDLQEERQDLVEQQQLLAHQLATLEAELHEAKAQTQQTTDELRSIQQMMASSSMDQLRMKKVQMKEMLVKAEDLRQTSQNLQQSIKRYRDQITAKETTLSLTRKKMRSSSLVDPDPSLAEKETILLKELKAERNQLQQAEKTYDDVLVELQLTMDSIDALELDISQRKSQAEPTPRWNEDKGRYRSSLSDDDSPSHPRDRLEKTFDPDTAQYLPLRKDQITDLLPQLRAKVEELETRKQTLLTRKGGVDASLAKTDDSLSELKERIRGNEVFIEKKQNSMPPSPSSSPLKPKSRSQQAMDALKALWRRAGEADMDFDAEDLPGAVIKVAKGVADSFEKRLQEKEVEFSTQQRIDQANISVLNTRLSELAQENERLRLSESESQSAQEAKIRLKSLETDLKEAKSRISELEKAKLKLEVQNENYELKIEKLSQEELLYKDLETDRDALHQKVESLAMENKRMKDDMQKMDIMEAEEKVRLLRKEREEAELDLQDLKDQLLTYHQESQETEHLLSDLRRELSETEEELSSVKSELESHLPLQRLKEDKERAAYVVKKLGNLLGVSSATIDTVRIVTDIETRLLELQEDVSKADLFRANKEKFVHMYESNVAQLQSELEHVAAAKQDLHVAQDLEAERVAQLKDEKAELEVAVTELAEEERTLREQSGDVKGELDKVTRELLTARDALGSMKAQGGSLSETVDRLKNLKNQAEEELARVRQLLEAENSQYQSTSEELRSMKKEVLELRNEKLEKESWLNFSKTQQDKLEARRDALDEEVRTYEDMVKGAAERLADEEKSAQKELEAVKVILNEKRDLVHRLKEELAGLEEQLLDKQHERHILTREQESECAGLIDLKNSKKQLSNEVKSLEETIRSLQDEAKVVKGEMDRQKTTIAQKESIIAKIDSEVEAKRGELSTAKQEFATASRESALEKARLGATLEEIKQAESALAEAKSRFIDTQRASDARSDDLNRVTRAISEKEDFLSALHKEQSSLASEIDALQQRMTQLSSERESQLLEQEKARNTLAAVQQQKKAAAGEIQRLCEEFEGEEKRHRTEVDAIARSIAHGERTLKQLLEAIAKEKEKLQDLRNESSSLERDTDSLRHQHEAARSSLSLLADKLRSSEDRLSKLKEEEDTALVLLAVSGHRVDETVLSRISQLCRAEQHLSALRSTLPMRSTDEDQRGKSEIPHISKSDIAETDREMVEEDRVTSRASSIDISKLKPQVSEMQKLLEHLEQEQRRIRGMVGDDAFSFAEK